MPIEGIDDEKVMERKRRAFEWQKRKRDENIEKGQRRVYRWIGLAVVCAAIVSGISYLLYPELNHYMILRTLVLIIGVVSILAILYHGTTSDWRKH